MPYRQDLEINEEAMLGIVETNQTIIKNCIEKLYDLYLSLIKEYQQYELLEDDIYQQYKIEIMVNLIDIIAYAKELIFETILSSYNEFIKDGVDIKDYLQEFNEERKDNIEKLEYDIKKTGIISAVTIFLVPNLIPFVAIINGPIVGMDLIAKRKNQDIISNNQNLLDEYVSVQKSFFELTDYLRTDYHQSKEKIKELKIRAQKGEDISIEALQILKSSIVPSKEEQSNKAKHLRK